MLLWRDVERQQAAHQAAWQQQQCIRSCQPSSCHATTATPHLTVSLGAPDSRDSVAACADNVAARRECHAPHAAWVRQSLQAAAIRPPQLDRVVLTPCAWQCSGLHHCRCTWQMGCGRYPDRVQSQGQGSHAFACCLFWYHSIRPLSPSKCAAPPAILPHLTQSGLSQSLRRHR